MKNESYDLIGDIHGEAEALRDLLRRLGYAERGGCYRHPERRVLFVGDYIDRGPAVRETLWIVRRMVDEGCALALCGNHEFDILKHDTPDGAGGWLRPRNPRDSAMHARTHAAFAGRDGEWQDWLRWFQTLPLHLELAGFRTAHACWSSAAIATLGPRNRLDDELLRADPETPLGAAVSVLLKGPTVRLPSTVGEGVKKVRVRWWLDGRGMTYRQFCIGWKGEEAIGPDRPIVGDDTRLLAPLDAEDQRPIFIGHYWLKPTPHPALLSPKVACVDFSVAHGGPLMAYRWDGGPLRRENFVFDPQRASGAKEPCLVEGQTQGIEDRGGGGGKEAAVRDGASEGEDENENEEEDEDDPSAQARSR